MNPKFSIIIPVYNVAPYLRECLDSVLAQTFTDWEAICVDDGSTDGSGAILDEYAENDGRIRVIHQENRGVSAARNVGIEHAHGYWLSFVDSDDVVPSDYLQLFFESPKKADINFFPMEHFPCRDGNAVMRLSPEYVTDYNEIARVIHGLVYHEGRNLFGFTSNKFIRRKVIDASNVRFKEGFNDAEDEIFAFDLCRHVSSLQVMPSPVYRYRIHDFGLSHTATRDKARGSAWLIADGDADTRFEYKVAAYSRASAKLFAVFLQCPSLKVLNHVSSFIVQHRKWLSPRDSFCRILMRRSACGLTVFKLSMIIVLLRNRLRRK